MESNNEKLPLDSLPVQDHNPTLELLLQRASCRSFINKKIENKQTQIRIAQWCEQQFVQTAPIHLLFCIDWHRLKRWAELENAPFSAYESFRHFWISFQDTIICCQNMCTAADSLGLGSVYIGTVLEFFHQIKEVCQLPSGVMPVVLLCLGYPKHRPVPRKKLSASQLLHNEIYRNNPDMELKGAFSEKYSDARIEITEDRLRTFQTVCENLYGKEGAENRVAHVKSQGYFNSAQRYFGLHYRADTMAQNNHTFLNTLYEFGFTWVKAQK